MILSERVTIVTLPASLKTNLNAIRCVGFQIKRKFPLSFVIAYASIAFVLLFKAMTFAISSPNDLESDKSV
jgi:hypothetical protein